MNVYFNRPFDDVTSPPGGEASAAPVRRPYEGPPPGYPLPGNEPPGYKRYENLVESDDNRSPEDNANVAPTSILGGSSPTDGLDRSKRNGSIVIAIIVAIMAIVLATGACGIAAIALSKTFQREQQTTVSSTDRLQQIEMEVERLQQLNSEVEQLKTSHMNLPRSCDDISGTVDQSGFFVISPDGSLLATFYVYCNFSGATTETIISHDSIDEIKVEDCEPERCYKRKIQYDVAMSYVVAVIEQSESCRQFIKYRCMGSFMFRNGGSTIAAWLSRNGTEQTYWGGATSLHDRHCACGITGTCVDNSYKCNCDRNRSPETSDEGYLTDKDSLPVTELQFGDTGASTESGWHTLGPLICSGRSIP